MAFVAKRLHSLQRTFYYLGVSFARNYRNCNRANRLSAVIRPSFSTKGSLWSTSAVGFRGHKLFVLTGGGSLVSFGVLTAVLCSAKNSANCELIALACVIALYFIIWLFNWQLTILTQKLCFLKVKDIFAFWYFHCLVHCQFLLICL